MSLRKKRSSKFLFWKRIQLILFLILFASIVLCFIISWWFLLLGILFLIINGIAYKNRLLSLGKNPSTENIDEVV